MIVPSTVFVFMGHIVLLSVNEVKCICPFSCQCDEDTLEVKCLQANLDIIPITFNPMIRSLHLVDNNIKTVDFVIHLYSELHYLDLSQNCISQVADRSFESQRKLLVLKMTHNSLIDLRTLSFFGLHNLTKLDISHNFVSVLKNHSFVHLARLRELLMEWNRIQTIEEGAFDGLVSLETISLKQNRLRFIAEKIFRSVPKLAALDVSSNQLGCRRHFDSAQADELRSAACSVNLKGLKQLSSLHFLSLKNNGIAELPLKDISFLSHLESLELGGNDFLVLDSASFWGMNSVRYLDLTRCNSLTAIKSNAFSGAPHLEIILINDNPHLERLDENSFSNLNNLRIVEMKNNRISSLSFSLFKWESLKRADLSGNPLTCNCSLSWLRNLLRSMNRTTSLSPISCYFPESLNSQFLENLSAEDLGCNVPVKTFIFVAFSTSALSLIMLCLCCTLWKNKKKRLFSVFHEDPKVKVIKTWEDASCINYQWPDAHFYHEWYSKIENTYGLKKTSDRADRIISVSVI